MGQQRLRALRGATTAPVDEAQAIVEATASLLAEMLERNEIARSDLVSLIFTTTADLTAEFPAAAARRLGISSVPLLCASEIAVPGSVPRCIRVLMHLYTDKNPDSLRHVYLEGAQHLRADLEAKPEVED
jgi:chorismate mutase